MKKKCLYIVMLLISFVCISFCSEVQAVGPIAADINVDNIFQGINFSTDTTGNTGIKEGTNLAAGIVNNAIAIVQIIGLGIAIIMLFSLGMKYMVGSVEDKAEVKKHAMVYVIGAVIFFAATAILEIIQMFIKMNFIVY